MKVEGEIPLLKTDQVIEYISFGSLPPSVLIEYSFQTDISLIHPNVWKKISYSLTVGIIQR